MSNKDKQARNLSAEELQVLEMETLPDANIIVAGGTGVGKSTLLNAIFGEKVAETGTGRPITDSMKQYKKEGIPIRIWDTVGLEMDAEKTKKSIQDIKDTIANTVSLKDPMQTIHAIWYCINSGSNRYQGAELDFIYDLYSVGVPFIIVLTQCERDPSDLIEEIKRINKERGMENITIVKVLAQEVKLINNITIPAFGLTDLVEETLKQMPSFIKTSFIAAQKIDKVEKRKVAEKLVLDYAEVAKYKWKNKIPIINILMADIAVKDMFVKIGQIYNMVMPEFLIDELINNMGSIEPDQVLLALLCPLDMIYDNRLKKYFDIEKESYIYNPLDKIEAKHRVSRMLVYYGYAFITTMELVREKYAEEMVAEVDQKVKELSDTITKTFNMVLHSGRKGKKDE